MRQLTTRSLRSYSSLWLVLSLLCLFSCKHTIGDAVDPVIPIDPGGGGDGGGGGGGAAACDPDVVYFERDVLPILIANCTRSGCHDAASAQNGVVLTSYDHVMATADVRPNDPENSDLYEVLVEDDPDKMMPQGAAPLPADQIALIRKWISQGAQDLTCSDEGGTCNTENVTFSGYVQPFLQTRCVGCHNGNVSNGGINLSTHAGVQAAAGSGRLLGAIRHEAGFTPMPQGGQKLDQCDIDKIAAWVTAGALNN